MKKKEKDTESRQERNGEGLQNTGSGLSHTKAESAADKRTAYERFRLQWMLDHRHTLTELIHELDGLREDGDGANTVQELFELWERDRGFGSEVWPCFAEFLKSEYQQMLSGDAASGETDNPFANDEEGVCPVCGSELKYEGNNNIDDDGGTFPWECPGCGASGLEGYNRAFDRHYNVCYANGDPVPGREEE